MADDEFTVAVVCSSNMNRSMEAHAYLKKKGFNVRSFGTGDKVRLPGHTQDKPNIFDFGYSYDNIYNDLINKNKSFYTQNGLLSMLDRNRRIKAHPEKFQSCKEEFTVIITCEERVFDQVVEHFDSVSSIGNTPVHVINIDIKDDQEDATIGAFLICGLVDLLSKSEDLDHEICQLLVEYDEKCHPRPIFHNILFY